MADTEQSISAEEQTLVTRIIRGDKQALARLFDLYRPRLWRMVHFRLHPRLQGRVDADDVLQEAWMRAMDRIDSFLADASRSPFIWLRMIVGQTLIDIHRKHVKTSKRDATKERSIHGGWSADSTSSSLAFALLGQLTSPSSALLQAERARQLDTALQDLSDTDREVLALRHFEELSNRETALCLNMSEQAASARYIRALARLKTVLQSLPGFSEESQTLL